ncbi:hypothetical protein FHR32_000321 [Streptosporangium album]|uniref:DUF2637 domain-containing protein n=1 Tax=Streptosporangium album TaxID=47479 RepID=A0A7W7W6Q6_9ACTN|nr:DUF2637 domain-containing protein [Streptosporangium album]MBB4936016.1 hypothetical protein [Streptosporangium album]
MELKWHGRRILGRMWSLAAAPFRARTKKASATSQARPATGTEASGDRLIRGVAIAILLGVAGAAAYVSYHHFYALALALGEPHDMAILYPAMSDGVIVMASLVMVYCSRRNIPVPLGVWIALMLGCVVTLVANVAQGWNGGLGSRLLSALAPVAFVLAYELLMWLVRSARQALETSPPEPVAESEPEHVCQPETIIKTVTETVRLVAVDRYEAARLAYEESLEPGRKRLGWRPLKERWGIEAQEAKDLIAEVDRERQEQTVEEPTPEPPVPPALKAAEPGEDRYDEDAERTDFALKNAILSTALNGHHAISVPKVDEPTDEELTAGMTPAEMLAGPGITALRQAWRDRAAATNGSGPEPEDDDFPGVLDGHPIDREEFLRTGTLVPLNGRGPAGGAR